MWRQQGRHKTGTTGGNSLHLDQCRVVRIWLCGGNKEGPGQELLAATHCIWTSAEWLGFDYVEATRKAQDRNYWRQLIASGPEPGTSTLNVLNYKYKYFPPQKYLSTSTFLFGEMYSSTFRVLSKCT